MNAVPYSGPAAPPTVLMSVRPAGPQDAAAAAASVVVAVGPPGRRACATIAAKPRSMLMPWSPSPIAWSSAVSAGACSWIRSAASRSQALEHVDHR